MPLDFGIGEALAGFLVSAGIGAETAGIAAPIIVGGVEGAGLGAASSAATGGDVGRGALFGGLGGGAFAGLGELAGGVGGAGGSFTAGADTGATFADSLTPATTGTLGGAGAFIDSGTFAGAGAASGLGGAGADLGASFGDSLTPATAGSTGGSFFDTSSALGAASPDAAAFQPTTAFAPGVTGGAGTELPGVSAVNTANTLGVAGASPGIGPGAQAFAPPSGVPLDATSAASLTNQAGLVGDGTNAIGLDVAAPGATGAQGTASTLGADFLPGQTGSAAEAQAELDSVQAGGGLAGGSPPAPPSVLSQIGSTLKGGVNDVVGAINSPLGKAAGVGIQGLSLAKDFLSPQQIPGQAALSQAAATQSALGTSLINQGISNQAAPTAAATQLAQGAAGQGQALSQYLTTGTLPPGVQGSIDQATKDAITSIKAQYAQRGMAGSSAETQDINSAKQRAVSQGANIALGLLQQGTSLESLSSQIYSSLIGQGNSLLQTGANLTGISTGTLNSSLQANVAQNSQTNAAIANLSRALAGGGISNTGTQAAA